uniref:CCR4-NOT transcription complex subunit 9 n=1 Tax=Trichobilharzia regenti TaxID=157069 RepID=A0AA85JPB1_TRIRE|nr:unnamed protein product [Trichobilharzia regenti]
MSTPSNGPETGTSATDMESVYRWVASLPNMETRENALLELCKRRESVPELAVIIWHSFGSVAALLQEICSIYPYINPPNLSAHQSNRVCNALAFMQCLASHPETRKEFLKANIPLYLYTFLNTNNQTRPFEYLRLTSLGVIGALVKTDEPEVIAFLLGSEIIPLCLVIMESGSELSRTVATFIMQKLLLDEVGLAYICQTYERFVHVATVLEKMVIDLAREQSLRLLKHLIRCYLRLSDNSRARDALRTCLPQHLTDGTFKQHYDHYPQNSPGLPILVTKTTSKSRITFALNVFSIVVIQLGVACSVGYLITQILPVSFWILQNLIFLWMSSFIYFVLEIVWAFIKSVPRIFPWNILYLFMMTFMSSYIIGCECLSYKDEVPFVAFAFLWTMLQVIVCFALFVVNDFTETLLSRIINILFGLSILSGQIAYFARRQSTITLLIAGCVGFPCTCYQLVKEVKLVFGGGGRYYSEENTIIPARNIYGYCWCLFLTIIWVYAPFGLRSEQPKSLQ